MLVVVVVTVAGVTFFSGRSGTSVSVVSTMPTIEATFWSDDR